MLVGFGMSWMTPMRHKLLSPRESPLDQEISFATISLINVLIYIGCIIGPYFTGYFSNIFGRKPCLLVGGIITALSFLLIVFTCNLIMIYAVRILQGFGIGIIAVGNIIYLGEIASTKIRGILLSALGIATTLGALLIKTIGPYVSFARSGWIGLGISLIYIGAGLFIPETPIFFMIKETEDEAKRILINLGRGDKVDEILATKKEKKEKTETSAWKQLFTVRSNRRALTMLLTLTVFQQLSGMFAMLFYAEETFYVAGLPQFVSLIIGILQLGSSCLTPVLVETFGRKKLLLISTSVCSICLAVQGGYLFCHTYAIGFLPPTTLIAFLVFYNLGFGIIPSTLTGEMFSSNVRSLGSAVTLSMTCFFGLVVSIAFGLIMEIFGFYIFWFFAASCACATVFTAFYVPETKGKSLLEVQEMME